MQSQRSWIKRTRAVTFGVALVCATLIGWQAWRWQQALQDVKTMLVPTVMLPTAAAPHKPTAGPAAAAAAAPKPSPTALPSLEAPLNVLLLGTDTRAGITSSRTDAIAVVHIDPQTHRVGILSLPRDLWVTIPGHGEGRLNAAYPTGEMQIGAGYGPALAKQTVADLLGIPIEHFMLIDLNGFKTLIDSIGGIALDVPQAIDDPAYPTDDFGTIAIHFDAGPQLMDGTHALMYARTRHADSDFGRTDRQQQVLMAIFEQIKAQGLLKNLTNIDSYTHALRDSLRTDLSREDLVRLARLGSDLSQQQIERYAVGAKNIVMLEEPATFAAKPQSLKELVGALLGQTSDSRTADQSNSNDS